MLSLDVVDGPIECFSVDSWSDVARFEASSDHNAHKCNFLYHTLHDTNDLSCDMSGTTAIIVMVRHLQVGV